MKLEQIMENRSKKYAQLIEKLQRDINAAPEGSLSCKKEGKYYKWFQNLPKQKKRIYIPKKNYFTAAMLAKKMLDEKRLQDITQEKYAIDLYLKHHRNYSAADRFLEKTNEEMRGLIAKMYKPMNEKYDDWQNADFRTNTMYPENRKIRTLRGDLVRSKAEAMIADYLFIHHIPYRYECAFPVGEKTLYPDFLVIHPITGEVYIIEHFGLLDDETYFAHFLEKLKLYAQQGYYPDHKLICFYETGDHPLDTATIAGKLQEILNIE